MFKPKTKLTSRFFNSQYVAFLFLLPWLIGLLVFFVYPFFNSIQLSFSKISSLYGYKLAGVGWSNFYKVLYEDIEFVPALLRSFRQTVIYVPSIVILSMILAVFLNTKIKCRGFFRSAYFLPVILGTGYVMEQLLGQSDSTQAMVTLSRGLEVPAAVTAVFDENTLSVIRLVFDNITMILWKSGVQIIIFLSSLQSISPSLYESARVDGATEWENFWKITMPMLAPVTVMNVIYTVVDSFTDLSNPVIDYMLKVNQDLRNAGVAAAMSWIYLLMVLVIIAVVLIFARKSANGIT